MDGLLVPALLVGCVAATLGWAASARRCRDAGRRADEAERESLRAAERLRLLEEGRAAAADAVRDQAALAAQAAAEQLVRRAGEGFAAQERLARQRLESSLAPVTDGLRRFERKVADLEQARAAEAGRLQGEIGALLSASQATRDEARRLATALRGSTGVQGRWGEETLRNVLEAAGMVRWFDFEEQSQIGGEGDRRRPDVTVRLPGGGVFVIDAKVSLADYLAAQDGADEAEREAALLRHVQSLRGHVNALAGKAYWDRDDGPSPDFVALFVPGDGLLAAALERAPGLLAEAMDRRVLLVTPTTLFALCKAVACGWRVEEQAAGAREVAALGRELHKRLGDLAGHALALGKALDGAVVRYNAFVGSLEARVLPQARRFEELAAGHPGRTIPELQPLDGVTRPLTRLAPDARAPEPEPDAPRVVERR